MRWPIDRLWLAKRLALSEVSSLSIDDITIANEALDLLEDAEERASKAR